MINSFRDELATIKSKVKLYLSLGRFRVAEKLLQGTLIERGPLANIYNLLGLTYHRQSRFPEALAQFKKSQECNPQYIEATLNIIATLCDLSYYEEAQSIYEALGADAFNGPLGTSHLLTGQLANRHAQCGALYHELGFDEKATLEYDKALSLHQRMPDVKLALAKIHIEAKQWDRAEKELEQLLSLAPELAPAHSWLGILYFLTNRRHKARMQWEKAFQLDEKDPTTRAYLTIASDWPLDAPLGSQGLTASPTLSP